MPLPESFRSAVSAFDPVLALLAIEPKAFDTRGVKDQSLGKLVDGNDEFSAIASASVAFGNMEGLTVNAFRKYYLDRFPFVTQRQYAVVQMLKAAVVGEQQLWTNLQQDVTALIAEGTHAFRNGGQSGKPSQRSLEVAKVVAKVASLFPPLQTVGAVVETGFEILLLLPQPKQAQHTYALPGDTAEDLWSSLVAASNTIKRTAGDQERTLGGHMDRIQGLMDARPGKFDLGRIDDDYGRPDQSADEELASETDPKKIIGVIDLNLDIVIDTGDELKKVATVFGNAARLLDGSLESSGPWLRSGEIGSGYTGHYERTEALASSLVTILLGTATALTDAGDVVAMVARRMKAGDDDIGADLRRRQCVVEAQRAPN